MPIARMPRPALPLLRSCWRLLALAVAFVAHSPTARSMDLIQVYEAARTQDLTLRAARATEAAARERQAQARAQLLPSLSLSVGRSRNDLTRTQTDEFTQEAPGERYLSYNQTLQLRQPLFRKPLFAALAQARYVGLEAAATLERERQALLVRVTGAYLEVSLAQEQVELVRAQQAAMQTQLAASRKAFATGFGTRTDIDEAQARLDMGKARALEASQQLALVHRQLEILINQPAGELAPLDPAKLVLRLPEPASLEAWIALAEGHSPELRALTAGREAARLELEKAEAGHYPTLDVLAQITRSASESVTSPGTGYSNRMIGVQLNLPLYAGGQVSSLARQAMAEQSRAEALLELARRELAVQLHREFRGVTEGILKVRALEQALKSAEQLVLSSQRSWQAGSRTVVDIFNAQEQSQLVRRDLAQARAQQLMSRVRLVVLSGQDGAQMLAELNGWLMPP